VSTAGKLLDKAPSVALMVCLAIAVPDVYNAFPAANPVSEALMVPIVEFPPTTQFGSSTVAHAPGKCTVRVIRIGGEDHREGAGVAKCVAIGRLQLQVRRMLRVGRYHDLVGRSTAQDGNVHRYRDVAGIAEGSLPDVDCGVRELDRMIANGSCPSALSIRGP
jgi:hypothetical protein